MKPSAVETDPKIMPPFNLILCKRCNLWLGLMLCVTGLPVANSFALDYAALQASAGPERAARYEVFRNFQIKGICGTARLDLATNYGANTIRTYVPPTREQLDKYQRLGLKVIAGIWMPHQGKNQDKKIAWDYDYRKSGQEALDNFGKTVDQIGDHPALLMWCLGNEVPLEPAYLETVNRMSELLHQKHPNQLTSITIINAPKEKIALIKQLAPDLDVIGFNSYGQGAVGTASNNLEQEWGRAYYVSEFGPQGPWWGRKTAWGEVYEQSYNEKLEDLSASFRKIDAAPRCLGSTMFLWGFWSQQKPTFFSAFLSPQGMHTTASESEFYITPMAEEFSRYWSGKYPAERGPVMTKIQFDGVGDKADVVVQAGKRFTATATAVNPGTSTNLLQYRWWILKKDGTPVSGPINSRQAAVELEAPASPGEDYFVMAFVIAVNQRASGFTVPIKVEPFRAISILDVGGGH
jgi:hypothetical protein